MGSTLVTKWKAMTICKFLKKIKNKKLNIFINNIITVKVLW
jgi:hypothetical protein